MPLPIKCDDEAMTAALHAAQNSGCPISGKVRSVVEIYPGHRLSQPFVQQSFWMVRLELEPPKVKSRFTIMSGIPDDLPLLVMQNGRVFHWWFSEEELPNLLSDSYVAGSSHLELTPGPPPRIVSLEQLQKEQDEIDDKLERMLEAADRENQEIRRQLTERSTYDEHKVNESDVFELPNLDDLERP